MGSQRGTASVTEGQKADAARAFGKSSRGKKDGRGTGDRQSNLTKQRRKKQTADGK